MKHNPWFKFDAASWLNDIELRSCSMSERGLLIDLMCLAHRNEPYGYLPFEDTPEGYKKLAKMLSIRSTTVANCMQKLRTSARIMSTDCNKLYIKRMVEDNDYANKQREFGKKGGNPTLKGGVKIEKKREEEKRIDIGVDWDIVISSWNKIAKEHKVTPIKKLTSGRKEKYKRRCDEAGGEGNFWAVVETEVPRLNDFARDGSWFDFDYVVRSEETFNKLAEGNWRRKSKARPRENCI